MKVKNNIFYFEPGNYAIGDISNLFEEKDFKKIKTPISKLKLNCGINGKYGFHYFKGISRKYIDYIEYNSYIIAENCLALIPAEMVKSGRLTNCKRFKAKSPFTLEYKNDKMGVAIYLKEMNEPGPFMMLVQEIEPK